MLKGKGTAIALLMLSKALNARKDVFLKQATATWYQLDPGPNDAAASFTSFTTTNPPVTPPPPSDPKQTQNPGNGDPWDVDHILELQILAGAFSAAKGPAQIPSATYTAVSSAIFTKGPANNALAQKITVLDNLQAIPNRVNGFKKNVVRGNLTGKSYPGENTYYGFLGPGVQKYLTDARGRLFGPGSVADKIGDELQSAGNNEAAVKDYFTSFASSHYQGAVDYLSTWSGLPYTRPSTSTASTSIAPTTTVVAAATTTPATSSSKSPPPPPYATGQCSFHLTETEFACESDDKNLYANIHMVDNAKNLIGDTDTSPNPAGASINAGDSYSFQPANKLPYPLVVTGEHKGDYIQFTYGGLSWQSKSPNGGASCNNGGWDPRQGPSCGRFTQNAVNNMDCSFPC